MHCLGDINLHLSQLCITMHRQAQNMMAESTLLLSAQIANGARMTNEAHTTLLHNLHIASSRSQQCL